MRWARRARPCCTSCGERDYDELSGARDASRTTGSSRSPRNSARRSVQPTSRSRARAAPSGSSPRPASPRCSSRVRFATADHQAQERRVLRASAEVRWSCRSRSVGRVPTSSLAARRSASGLRRWRAAMLAARPARCRGRDRRGAHCPRLLPERRFWIAGIGGAGMSAYALLAQAWGAEVRGWDRVRDAVPRSSSKGSTSRSRTSRRSRPRAGRRSSRPRSRDASPGRPRAELLAELVSLRDSIVVAGAHGKTTTSGDDRVLPRAARAATPPG